MADENGPFNSENDPGLLGTNIQDEIIDRAGQLPGTLSDIWENVNDSTLGQSKYDFTSRIFPTNLEQLGHYMVININVPNRSTYQSLNGRQIFTRLNDEFSKTDVLRFNLDKRFYDANGGTQYQGAINRPRFTRRIAESIALWTPQTMQYVQRNDYADISLTNMAGRVSQFALNTGLGLIGGAIGAVNGSLGNAIIGIGDVFAEGAQIAAQGAALVGAPINPKVEYLFRNTPQREFLFDFMFAPENQKDSIAMEQIIKTLRFHAAPEIDAGTYGFTYTPPSEFDITFYHRGQENTKIPRINTCVLTQIDVDYAPSGVWSTFYNGHPSTCRMQLRFMETEVVHKLRVAQGF